MLKRFFNIFLVLFILAIFSSRSPIWANKELGAPIIKNYFPKDYKANSQSNFYRVFKLITQMTPTQYRKTLKKQQLKQSKNKKP